MANYISMSRTNYFTVTDEEKYQELFSNLVGEGCVYDFTKEENGIKMHGFGCESSVDFLVPGTDDTFDFNEFLIELQKILPKGEAFIYTEIGNEKLRYLSAYSIIVTKDKIENVSLRSEIIKKTHELLKNDAFATQLEY